MGCRRSEKWASSDRWFTKDRSDVVIISGLYEQNIIIPGISQLNYYSQLCYFHIIQKYSSTHTVPSSVTPSTFQLYVQLDFFFKFYKNSHREKSMRLETNHHRLRSLHYLLRDLEKVSLLSVKQNFSELKEFGELTKKCLAMSKDYQQILVQFGCVVIPKFYFQSIPETILLIPYAIWRSLGI